MIMKLIIDIPDSVYNKVLHGDIPVRIYEIIMRGIPLTSEQYKIVQRLYDTHEKAQYLDYVRNPLVWSLYQVWKEVDNEKR